MRDLLQFELQKLLRNEFPIELVEKPEYEGDWTAPGAHKALQAALNDPATDLVIALGTLVSLGALKIENPKKPLFAPFLLNEILSLENPDHPPENLSYLTFPSSIAEDLSVLKKIAPIPHVSFLVEEISLQAIPELPDTLREIGRAAGLQTSLLSCSNTSHSLDCIPEGKDTVIYILPLIGTGTSQRKALFSEIQKRGLVSFSLFSQGYVDQGVLASAAPDLQIRQIVRKLALNIQQTLLGTLPRDLDNHVERESNLVLNMTTASKLGVSVPWEVLLEAQQIYEEEGSTPTDIDFSLPLAVRRALACNHSLQAGRLQLAASSQDSFEAAAALLPHIHVGAEGRAIDKDRARASLGVEPQGAGFLHLKVHQLLYSNELYGNVRVQMSAQRARLFALAQQEVELIAESVISFLDLLRASTIEKIHLHNLALSRYNLRLAERRKRVGMGTPSEVYRWENQIASNQRETVQTHYDLRKAASHFNRLLDLPQECHPGAEGEEIGDYFPQNWFTELMRTTKDVEQVATGLTRRALTTSPVITQLYYEVQTQAKVAGIAWRAFWAPNAYLDADLRQLFARSGEEPFARVPIDKTDWRIGVRLEFPLLEGGAKSARRRRACCLLKALVQEYNELLNLVAENVRKTLYQAYSDYLAIDLAKKAADAARKNLALITDAYSKGSSTIIDLLDAQNQALTANLRTANAEYDFLISLARLEANLGEFTLLLDPQKRKARFHELKEATPP